MEFSDLELPRGRVVWGSAKAGHYARLSAAVKSEFARSVPALLSTRSICFLRPIKPLIYPDSEEAVATLWADGLGMAVQHVETRNPAVRRLCHSLSRRYHSRVTASIYVSGQHFQSFNSHIDMWDAWLFQISGSKVFLCDIEAGSTELDLRPSKWLWLASGVRHRVETRGECSVHLSVNVHRRFF